jgi:hypothetical protein
MILKVSFIFFHIIEDNSIKQTTPEAQLLQGQSIIQGWNKESDIGYFFFAAKHNTFIF